MGRGGPAEPEVIERRPTVSDLVELSRSGRHAASDYLEIAAICGVPTIGCRRAGGGLAGQVFVSNVVEGARLAAEREPDVVVFDSSGASIPPIAVDRRVLLVGDWHDVDSHFNTYRRLVSDLVVAVNCELPGAVTGDAAPAAARAARGPRRRLHRRAAPTSRTSTPTSSTSRRASPTATPCAASWRGSTPTRTSSR